MNRLSIWICQTCVVLTAFARSALAESPAPVQVDWPAFMAQQDPIWDQMPRDYYEGPFVGNGLLGTIMYRDDEEPNTLRFEIGRTDVYDHRDGGSAIYERCRLPIGQLLLHPAGKITSAHFRTDLWNAEVRADLTTDAGEIHFTCFDPSDSQVIVIDVRTTGNERGATFHFRPQQGNATRVGLRKEKYPYKPNPPFTTQTIGGCEAAVQPLLAGGDYATLWQQTAGADADHRTLWLSVAIRTDRTGAVDDARANVHHAEQVGLAKLQQAHRQWWHAYYPASFVSLPDARIESFYWIQWYKLASATRSDCPVVDLIGPWFRPSVWMAYWQNLNVQLPYYTVQVGNHLEIGERLTRWLEDEQQNLIQNCPPEFRGDSAALGNPTGLHLVAPVHNNPAKYGWSLIALPWLMQHCYMQYRYTMDDQQLRALYPLMSRTFNFYLHIIQRGDDGKYHIPKAFSDEYGPAQDTNLNLALLRWGLQTLLDSNDRLHLKDPLAPKWKEVLAGLVDPPTDPRDGLMIGRDTPFAHPHRHYSHLFAIFPLYIMNIDQGPATVDLMRRSVQHYIGLDGDNCMFKYTGASSLFAALGDGNIALKYLQEALTIKDKGPHVTPNTLYSENGWPTFESPISAGRDVLDMLLQSWGGKIRVFPACPDSWKDARFSDLRAQGAFMVSAVRAGGYTQFIRIRSLAGESCIIKCDLADPIHAQGDGGVAVRRDGDALRVDLAKGQEVLLYSGDKAPAAVISPLPIDPATANAWGVHGVVH